MAFHTPAELNQRIEAAVIDAILVFIALAPLGFVFDKNMDTEVRSYLVLAASVLFLTLAIVQSVLLARHGYSVGKWRAKILVCSHDGSLPGFRRAVLLRGILFWGICLVPVIGQIFLFVNAVSLVRPYSRTLRDKIADTLVVQAWE